MSDGPQTERARALLDFEGPRVEFDLAFLRDQLAIVEEQARAAPSPALTREALAQALVAETDNGGPPAVWDLLDERGRDYFRGRADTILGHLAALGTPPPAPTWKVTGKTLAEWDTGTSTLTSTREETP